MESNSLNYWRNYFQTANTNIFDIIDHAIMVAASDFPNEFRLRRVRISEHLFSWRSTGRDDVEEMNTAQVSNFSFEEAEGLTGEIEKESKIVTEILRIKEILYKEEADSVLFESLRRLQPLALTVDLLKEIEIGKAINPLKKHGSNEIRQLARTLINGWKAIVDEWINSTKAIEAKGILDSISLSIFNEGERLHSPVDKVAMRYSKLVYTDSSSGRQPKSSLPQKSNIGPKVQHKKEIFKIKKRPLVAQQDCQKFKRSDDVSVQAKLEATKRKLHDSYQQAANAKKQRTIRVIELHDLPKQRNIGPRNQHSKLWKVLGRRR